MQRIGVNMFETHSFSRISCLFFDKTLAKQPSLVCVCTQRAEILLPQQYHKHVQLGSINGKNIRHDKNLSQLLRLRLGLGLQRQQNIARRDLIAGRAKHLIDDSVAVGTEAMFHFHRL